MGGAIFYSGQYGSTAQYAEWISEATGLPVFDVLRTDADPADFDFLVLGSSIIVYKPTIRKWVGHHLAAILERPAILFTVAGAPPGPKVDGWVAEGLPARLVAHIDHVALRGRMDPETLGWWHRTILKVGAWMNRDPEARHDELHGFDYMDQGSIIPIVQKIETLAAER